VNVRGGGECPVTGDLRFCCVGYLLN